MGLENVYFKKGSIILGEWATRGKRLCVVSGCLGKSFPHKRFSGLESGGDGENGNGRKFRGGTKRTTTYFFSSPLKYALIENTCLLFTAYITFSKFSHFSLLRTIFGNFRASSWRRLFFFIKKTKNWFVYTERHFLAQIMPNPSLKSLWLKICKFEFLKLQRTSIVLKNCINATNLGKFYSMLTNSTFLEIEIIENL